MSNRSKANPTKEPASFLEMRSRIVARYPDLSPQLQSIAQFALASPETMAVETAVQLAQRLGVQPSSLVRFAHALGYRGFNEMKRSFRANLIFRMADKRDREATRRVSAAAGNGVLGVLIEEGKAQLDWLATETNPKEFDKAVVALIKANETYVVAQHIAFHAASLFAWTLLRFGRRCQILDNTGGFALRQSELAGRKDVMVAISLSPYQASVVQGAKAHFERGGKVVAVTDTPLSPLAPYASILLEAPQPASATGGSMVGVTCLVQALAVAVVRSARLGSRLRSAENEPIRP